MALYSVWDWKKNAYAIYATDKPVSVGEDPTAPEPVNVGPIGAVPDVDVKVLPRDAKRLGYDQMPRGEIVREGRGIFGLGDAPAEPGYSLRTVIGVGGVALLVGAWWGMRRAG